MKWSVYIIQASDSSYYTGIATDIERRFQEHCNSPLGAKYFNNGRRPKKVVYAENEHTRSSASQREAAIKKLTRRQKITLIDSWIQSTAK